MGVKLSLIICSRDCAEKLKKCLELISAAEMLEVNGELILVNNGSTDKTEEVMRSFKENSPFPIKIVNEPKPGLGRARNVGILEASADVLVFIDDDCYLTEGYLRKASKVFEPDEFQYCGGRILLYDKSDAMSTVDYRDKKIIIPPYSIVYPGRIRGCNMVIHRKIVDKIGFFDPMFGAGTLFPCEDVDYLTRASLAGFIGARVPELVLHHHHGRKLGADVERIMEYYAYGAGAFFMKLILMGEIAALKHWIPLLKSSKDTPKPDLSIDIKNRFFLFIWEIRGGVHYLLKRLGCAK